MNTTDARLLEATNRAERAELQARKELADCEKRLAAANKREHELEEDILRLTARLHAAEKFVDHDMKRMEERLAAAEAERDEARLIGGSDANMYLRQKLAAAEFVVEAARELVERGEESGGMADYGALRAALASTKAYKVEPPTLHSEAATQSSENLNFSKREGDSAGARVVPADFKTPADSPDAE